MTAAGGVTDGSITAPPQALARVFSPIDLGPIRVPNRVVRTAHLTKFSLGAAISDDLIAYHLARGRGGVGLTVLEATAVHPSSVLALIGYDDAILDGYRRLVEAVRPTGMRLFQQLWHAGHVYNPPDGSPPRGVSRLPGPVSGVPAVPFRTDEIPEIVAAFANAARRSVSAGIDGIEIAASHGYLIHQFLSPLTNDRSDGYGGSLENRMRFLIEVLQAVRAAIGPAHALGMRVGAGQVEGDLSEQDLAAVVRRVEGLGLIDYLNVSSGDYYRMAEMTGAMDRPAGYQLPSSTRITAASALPRIVTGRFRTLEEVEQVLREGHADLVSMVRAHIADPDIVIKTARGDGAQVRPCIGCNQGCLARTSGWDARLGCTVNPAVGREATLGEHLITAAPVSRRVVVVGAGPAGMEAARVASLRGHAVTVFEAADRLGGALSLARLAPQMQGIDDILEWYRTELRRLEVDIRLNTPVDAADIVAAEPDAVILATGAGPGTGTAFIATPGTAVAGLDRAHVLSPAELLSTPGRPLGATALVYDDLGQYEAIALTEYLVVRGVAVTVATRFAALGPGADLAQRLQPALDRLARGAGSLEILTRTTIAEVLDGTVRLQVAGRAGTTTVPAELVVLVRHQVPVDSLGDELRGQVAEIRVAGDALSARDLQVAIREGHLAGRSVGA
jgi:2,4-dienoyl-CoA reductase-like NADH-dependent reductase (Old Yellow Enzyme family)